MTTPLERALSYDDAEELLAFELRASGVVTSDLRATLALIMRVLLHLWPGDDAPIGQRQAALAALPLDRLIAQARTLEGRITPYAVEALSIGVARAVAQADVGGLNALPVTPALPGGVATAIGAAADAIAEQVAKAKVLLRSAQTLTQAQTAVAVAQYGITRVEGIVRYTTNASANQGMIEVVQRHDDLVVVWRAERDACVHCLAYAGKVNSGKGYPKGLTFGDKPLHTKEIKKPPLHPNCRCDQVVWSPTWDNGTDTSIPDALRREAERSILRGWSVASESDKVRLRAAERLLARGVQLPKSVKQYARTAIRAGEFPRGTSFPGA